MDFYIIINIIEAIYIYYMFNIFKTNYSIHHPMEYFILKNLPDYYYHPISTGKYESKICPFGHLCGTLFILFFLFRIIYYKVYQKRETFITKIVIIIAIIMSLSMNMNAFIYLLPILLIEYYLLYC